MTVRNYCFYEGSQLVGSIKIEYGAFEKKERIKVISNDKNNSVSLRQIWVNDICIKHIKGCSFFIFSEKFENSKQHRKVGENYYLDFERDWEWLPNSSKMTIHYEWQRKKSFLENVLMCQRVLGLKRLIEKQLGLREGTCCLYFRKWPLEDNTTLEQLEIGDQDVIEVIYLADLKEGPSALQAETGGSYISIEMFENYFQQMEEKSKLVCQIRIPIGEGKAKYGSGFLIDYHLIITNYHVVETSLVEAKAKFLYHREGDQDLFEVDIDKKIVCFSTSPENRINYASETHLDYAILSLRPSQNMDLKQYECFHRIGLLAKTFFQNAKGAFREKQQLDIGARRIKSLIQFSRANIIQHPLKKN